MTSRQPVFWDVEEGLRELSAQGDPLEKLDATVGRAREAEVLAEDYAAHLAQLRDETAQAPRPKVYFEEWNDLLSSGIGWTSELIEVAGGLDVFSARARNAAARDRIVTPDQVIAAAPDVILASWCGSKVRPETIAARPGWDAIPAVRAGRVFEIKSPLILQPGPAALTDGLDAIRAAILTSEQEAPA